MAFHPKKLNGLVEKDKQGNYKLICSLTVDHGLLDLAGITRGQKVRVIDYLLRVKGLSLKRFECYK
ncbi:hypothetical protein [Caldivirga sp.]|uniref:hypothetical protein n=1 Tax=Caldivirga sp. TaxID=2080243 RepID=UPI0025C322AE|nr:hypothetical protein [Caldivirga sp.]